MVLPKLPSLQNSPTQFLRLAFLAVLAFWPLALPASWYSRCPACERGLGGDSRIGPFSTKPECQKYVEMNRDKNYPYEPCYGSDDASASASSTDSNLQQATTDALSHGIVHGNSEAFGLGLMGLGVMALTSAPSGPSPAQQAAERQASLERAQRYQAEQAAQKRKFDADKAETLQDLKGDEGEASPEDVGLKGDASDELKDVPSSPRKKKFKPPRLKPMANPLYKDPLPGDFTGATSFDDWDKAKRFAADGNGTIARESSGKIVWCPEGFPYYSGGHCYSSAAFNDHRVPGPSTLLTTKPE